MFMASSSCGRWPEPNKRLRALFQSESFDFQMASAGIRRLRSTTSRPQRFLLAAVAWTERPFLLRFGQEAALGKRQRAYGGPKRTGGYRLRFPSAVWLRVPQRPDMVAKAIPPGA
ncbi:hypothetical protein CK224_27425 [Mesorhizobium sp. WSM3862]|nr:hypothetical protein CK224_27425 [Mesorhizobium sp. WSM3862]